MAQNLPKTRECLKRDEDSEKDEISDTQNGSDLFDLFFDRSYIKQDIKLPSGRPMSFLGLKTAMTAPDLTGQILWPGCSLLMYWLDKNMSIFENKSCAEVGAGTAICSVFVAKYGKATKIVATDGSEPVVELIQQNIDLHLKDERNITCEHLPWEEKGKIEKFVKNNGKFDFVFGSEIAYNENCVEGLVDTVDALLKPDGKFVIGHIDRYAQTTRAFFAKIERSGFVKETESTWDELMDFKMEMIIGSVHTFKRK